MITLKNHPIPIESIIEYMVSVQTNSILIRVKTEHRALIFTYDSKSELFNAINYITDTLKGVIK